jgi:hypothetical protein
MEQPHGSPTLEQSMDANVSRPRLWKFILEKFGRLRSTYHRLKLAYPRSIDLETNLSVLLKEHEMF